jgi:YbbR domain-containing protein
MPRFWPFRHLGLKLMSVGLAVLLWLTVSGEEVVERGLRVPLELQQFPTGLEIQGEPPSTVDVRVRGTSGALSRVGAGDVVAVLDLHAARPGNRLFPVTPELVHSPYGVEVVQVIPSTILLSFEPSVTKEVPVVASTEGEPAPGYVVGEITVSPDKVEIVGPQSAVKRAGVALTETISLANMHESQTAQAVTVGLTDPALRLKNQRTVSINVQILPGPVERTIRNRPVHLRNVGPHLSAQAMPVVVDVGVRGSRESLSHFDADEITAYVDVGGLGAGDYSLAVHAEASDQAGVTHIDPATVKIRISSARN